MKNLTQEQLILLNDLLSTVFPPVIGFRRDITINKEGLIEVKYLQFTFSTDYKPHVVHNSD